MQGAEKNSQAGKGSSKAASHDLVHLNREGIVRIQFLLKWPQFLNVAGSQKNSQAEKGSSKAASRDLVHLN